MEPLSGRGCGYELGIREMSESSKGGVDCEGNINKKNGRKERWAGGFGTSTREGIWPWTRIG